MIKGILEFLKSKTFLKHLIIYVLGLVLLFWLITIWLGSYTSHGETVDVPNFSGVKIADLDQFVSDKNVKYLIIDSLYDTKTPPGVVVKQEPEPAEKVKQDRTIYLYVTSLMPPSIQMPKLVDRSLRQAAAMITTYGLKLGKTKFIPDQCANCILQQLVNDKPIEPGTEIAKGTVVDLVVGKGLSEEEVGVPCLYGLTRKEALAKLAEASLSIGAVSFDSDKDSLNSRVYRQIPACGKDASINMGATIDLFLTTDKNKVPAISDSTLTTTKNEKNFDE